MQFRYRIALFLLNLLPLLLLVWLAIPPGPTTGVATLWALVCALSGLGWLAMPAWRRLPQVTSWIGLSGLLFSPFVIWHWSSAQALILTLSAMVIFWGSGFGALLCAPAIPGVPRFPVTAGLAMKVVIDEVVLGYFLATLRYPRGTRRLRVIEESRQSLQLLRKHGWRDNPAALHPEPVLPPSFALDERVFKGYPYTQLGFENVMPDLELPGSTAWNTHSKQVYARLLEHPGGPRPWLMCIHGYRMGWLPLDFHLFRPGWLHHRLGFNLIMPILPLHGARKQGWRSGDGLFDGDIMRMFHAFRQGVFDLRCLMAWLRAEKQAHHVAVLGYSLGGFHAAMLASLEKNIKSLVAAIPLVDLPSVIWEHGPGSLKQALVDNGLPRQHLEELLSPLSPLQLPQRDNRAQLAIVAAGSDRLVPLEPIVALNKQWTPEMHWYNGSHLSIGFEPSVRDFLYQQWQDSGLFINGVNARPLEV